MNTKKGAVVVCRGSPGLGPHLVREGAKEGREKELEQGGPRGHRCQCASHKSRVILKQRHHRRTSLIGEGIRESGRERGRVRETLHAHQGTTTCNQPPNETCWPMAGWPIKLGEVRNGSSTGIIMNHEVQLNADAILSDRMTRARRAAASSPLLPSFTDTVPSLAMLTW
jgi:hypothetical protein